jgi:phosphate transport system substrate-binding protein
MRLLSGRAKVASSLAAVAAFALGTTPPASAGSSHDPIQGSGSSWSANAVNQWVADVESAGLKVVYTDSGSAIGRKDFAFKNVDFAVSDIGYQGQDPITHESDSALGRAYAYLPVVAGGTSFPYHVEVGGKLVRNLRLSGKTLAGIFTNRITNWNDPAITADNNGKRLPSLAIVPVVHSEGSGSTAQFTTYLNTVYPSIWQPFAGGNGFTEYYPRQGSAIAADKSDGVMNYVASDAGNGSIGYNEYSYALAKNWPVAKVLNMRGYYTLPTQYNVAVALTKAQIFNDPSKENYLLQKLDRVYDNPDPRTYPLSSYSYAIIPTAANDKITTAGRQTLADFLFYSVCGGQAEMGKIGYSPLPFNLVQASFDQTAKLKAADPGVNLAQHDAKSCDNPTFDRSNLNRNYLAEIAPQPPSCDQQGQGPCTGGGDPGTSNPGATGPGNSGGSNNGSGTPNSHGASTTPTGKTAAGTTKPRTSAAAKASTHIDPETGQVVGDTSSTDASGEVNAVPTDLAAYRNAGSATFYGIFSAALLGLAILIPPVLGRRLSSRGKGKP